MGKTFAIFAMLFKILVIVIIIFAFIAILYMLIRSRDEVLVELRDSDNEVKKYRKLRYDTMGRVVKAFGDGNPQTGNVTKLLKISSKIGTHEQELAWEQKYVIVMKRFMDYAEEHVSDDLVIPFQTAKDGLEANEQDLGYARTRYYSAKEKADTFEKAPKKQLVMLGDKLMSTFKKVDSKKKQLAEIAETNRSKQENADARDEATIRDGVEKTLRAKRIADEAREQNGFPDNPFIKKS